jgi:predicted ATP-dependent protease
MVEDYDNYLSKLWRLKNLVQNQAATIKKSQGSTRLTIAVVEEILQLKISKHRPLHRFARQFRS